MAGTDRNIRKSLMAHVRELFASPPAGSGLSPYTIYNEDDLLAVQASGKVPNRPCVFVLDAYMRPKPPALPMVIVEIPMIHKRPYELGNRNGRIQDAAIHVLGRRRGERDDLGSLIADYIGATFPVYTYTSTQAGDTGVFLENAEIEPDIPIEDYSARLSPDIRREGTLDLWVILTVTFRTKN